LKSELDLLDKTKEAELTLESLIESRKMLAARQTKLQSKLEVPDNSPSFIDSVQKELASVSADMDLRSKQIMELKQKIDSADLDAKAKSRMEYLQTMVEAKVCYSAYFTIALLLYYLFFKLVFSDCFERSV
jgi:kinesin family protein 4/21/27